MKTSKNKLHWEQVGKEYHRSWAGIAKAYLSRQETDFINRFLLPQKPRKILDIGIGNGRILANYLKFARKSKIYGIDISESMVDVCKKRFSRDSGIAELAVCDFSKEKLPFLGKFDFVSSIRVIKYNKNWREMIGKIARLLKKEGEAVFDMPNKYSLNIFSFSDIAFFRSTKDELEDICQRYNLEILEMRSFTRIPDVFYSLAKRRMWAGLIIGTETLLAKIFGKTFLGRILFLAVRKI